jgi:hypothetical protein
MNFFDKLSDCNQAETLHTNGPAMNPLANAAVARQIAE